MFVKYMCEKQNDCGLYKYLLETGRLKSGENCPKPDPEQCPRYNFAEGKNIDQARAVFRVLNVYTHGVPISYEESLL